jgi:hypothetical protein
MASTTTTIPSPSGYSGITSMTSLLYDLHNQGVDFLDHGDLPRAFQIFRSCLSQLHSVMHHNLSLSTKSMPMENNNNYIHSNILLPLSPSAYCAYGSSHDNRYNNTTSTTNTTRQQPWQNNRFNNNNNNISQQGQNKEQPDDFLFLLNTRGVRVVPTSAASSWCCCCAAGSPPGLFSLDPQHEANVFCALLVYHLGLVCHLASLFVSQDDRTFNYRHHHTKKNAKALYEQAQQLLSMSVPIDDCSSTGNAIVDLLHLSLLNNRAQLLMAQPGFHDDDDRAMSRHLLGRLVRLALHVKTTLLYSRNIALDGNSTSSTSTSTSKCALGWMMEQVDTYLFHAAMVGLLPLCAAAAA